jgi:hypothetical protein
LSTTGKASIPRISNELIVLLAKSIIQRSTIRNDSSCVITEQVIIVTAKQ